MLGAVERGYTKAEAPLKLIQALYRIERVAKERAEKKGTDTALFHARKEARRQSQKFVRDFFEQCRALKESERPSSPVAQAVSYALNIEEELKKFLKDARLNIDNNPAERLTGELRSSERIASLPAVKPEGSVSLSYIRSPRHAKPTASAFASGSKTFCLV